MSTEPVKADRLREAREYLGFSPAEVAAALGWAVGRVEDIESGNCTISGHDLRRLSRLYRRPIAWLQGETTFQPSPQMLRQLENPRLTDKDREAVLDFAEFLEGAGSAPKLTPEQERRRAFRASLRGQ